MADNYGSDDEEVVVLGTPFPALEDDQIVSKKPDLDLTVRDSQGRRRFHGAFTGGFSAGHYMTVGSEEGFTPQQFRSNRHEKWDKSLIQQKPESFMDSEDMDVFGIAPKRITTKDMFSEQQEFAGFRKTDSLIDVLKSVVKPSVESIGVKLYKRMKLKARNESKSEPKVYGCEIPYNTTANNDLSFDLLKPKSNFHGIGYKSMTEDIDSDPNHSLNGISAIFKSGRKIAISGEAFGYGVLDEDNEEEAVVYQRDDMSKYDFEIGSVRPNRKDRDKDKHKAIDVLKSDVIEGFVKSLAKINLMESLCKKYPKPVVPRDWKRSSNETKSRKSRWDRTGITDVDNRIGNEDKAVPQPQHVMNANMRAILLGEEVIHRQGIKKPVLDSISDSMKESSNEMSDKKSSIDAKNKDFLNRPLTGFWANKFTRSSDGPEAGTLSGGLTEFKSNETVSKDVNKEEKKSTSSERTTYEWHPHSLLCKRFNIPNPFPQYPDFVGVVTVGPSNVRNRTSKVFNKSVKQNIFDCLLDQNVLSNDLKPNDVINKTNDNFNSDVKSVANNRNENQNEEELDETSETTTTRPPMDLFKAIFASDEESDGEDSDSNDKQMIDNQKNVENVVLSDENKNDLNSAKTQGIFANIDFDELNRDFNPILNTNEVKNSEVMTEKVKPIEIQSQQQSEENDDFYGPALPPDSSLLTSSAVYSSIDLMETNRKSLKRKKKEKKHKKQKKQKTSHKHRHRKASTSSSNSSDIDSKIIDRMKKVRK